MPHQLTLRHLRVVVTVADAGSIGAASRTLGLSQPALSAQVRRIEALVGGALFARGPAGVSPTVAGQTMVDRGRELLSSSESLLDDLRVAAHRSTQLRVAGVSSSASFARFLGIAPGRLPVGFTSRTDERASTLDAWLSRGVVDVTHATVIPGVEDAAPAGIEQSTVIQQIPLLVALASDDCLARRSTIDLADLAERPWLLPRGRPDSTTKALLSACRAAGFAPDSPVGAVDLAPYASWVLDHGAVGFVTATQVLLPGITVRPLRRNPVVAGLVIRWDPHRVPHSLAMTIRGLFARAYVAQVAAASGAQGWWSEHPESRPALASDLRAELPWPVPRHDMP